MKIAVKAALFILSTVLLVLIVLDMSNKNTRSVESSYLANNATYSSISMLANGSYEIKSIDELVAEAIQDIVTSKESNSDIKVQVMGIDAENGLIDLNVIQTIKHVNGEITNVEERRTVILENYQIESEE